jgi:hypothetical protein
VRITDGQPKTDDADGASVAAHPAIALDPARGIPQLGCGFVQHFRVVMDTRRRVAGLMCRQ